MRALGPIVRLQVQVDSIKSGTRPLQTYTPTPNLTSVRALHLNPDGVEGVDALGGILPDVHNATHPATKFRDDNGISIGFTNHYETMRDRFGDHLTDGIAGENILVACNESIQLEMIENGIVIARKQGRIVGCLQAIGPITDFRPGAQGVYSPLTSCLVEDTDSDRIFTTLLTALGELPSFAGTSSAAFTCFPHHTALNFSLSQNAFGVRCADAVTAIDDLPTDIPDTDLTIEEVHWRDAVQIREVKESLAAHLASSPMFMERFRFTPEFVAWKSEQRESVHIIARDGDRIVGFIEATYEGENYLTRSPQMRNICGAGVLPEYRNRGIMTELLIALANRYRTEGITTLGVDYETFNPNARGFWERYFSPYTWSWERRFDMPWGNT